MIRRFTSAPKPCSRVSAMTSSRSRLPSSPTRRPYRTPSKRARLDDASLGRDQVVGGQREVEGRAGDLADLRAHALQQRDGLGDAGEHALLVAVGVALAAELADDADRQAGQVALGAAAGALGEHRHRGVDAGGVQRVVAADRLVQQRGVEDRAGHRAGLVQARGEGDEAVAGDRAVGGLVPDQPGERGGLADRAAGVGADRPRAPGRRRPPPTSRRRSRPGSARGPRGCG